MYFFYCWLLIGIGLTMVFWGIQLQIESIGIIGVFMVLLVVLIGFGFLPIFYLGNEIKSTTKDFIYIKSPTTLYIECNECKEKFQTSDVYMYNNPDKISLTTTKFINKYGFEMSKWTRITKD